MANTSVTTHQSWLSRLTNSVVGVLFGFGLVLGSGYGLFWNEGRTVIEAAKLDEGEKVVVTVPGDRVDPANEGKLVHVSAVVGTQETLTDQIFGIAAPEGAVQLNREVEMYQWDEDKHSETHKKAGGGTTKTTSYSYKKKWSSSKINSGSFHESGHSNPSQWPASQDTIRASQAKLGDFKFGPELLHYLSDQISVPLAGQPVTLDSLPKGAKIEGELIYIGENSDSPQVGDVRISFSAIPKGDASVVAEQSAGGFKGFMTKVKKELLLVSSGKKTSTQLFEEARTKNLFIAWAIRVGGFFAMWMGFGLIMRPLSVLGDVIPFVGNLIGAGTGFVAAILAFMLSVVIIAVGWFASRPLFGIGLLVLAAGTTVWLIRRNKRKKQGALLTAGDPNIPPPLNF